MDIKQKYKLKIESAKLLIKIYELALKKVDEMDSDKKQRYDDQIINLQTKRNRINSQVK